MAVLVYGLFWISKEDVQENTVGQEKAIELYRKFLGPDWKASHVGAGLQVSNHLTICDIFVLFNSQPKCASFVAKTEIAKIPGLGSIAVLIGCLFTKREGSQAEQRARVLSQIKER
jgi:1-acyl-sn-glycerol-3-phosphate acyltransferase